MIENAIKNYLDKRAEEDLLFAESYKKPGKSIKECCDYIAGQARKLREGSVAVVDDATVYGWAVHYYDEDDIKVDKQPDRTQVRISQAVELSDEEKARAREEAIEMYKLECIAREKAAEAEKKKQRADKAKARREAEKAAGINVPTLFSFDDL
jgi:hypothetical protein|nr:MAG TPA: PcfK-like protein [Caudoviricetes sp.]